MVSDAYTLNAATKTNCLHQLDAVSALTSGVCASWAKLMKINLGLAKDTLTDLSSVTEKLMNARDMGQWVTASKSHTKPVMNRTLSYCRDLNSLAAAAHSDFISHSHAVVLSGSRDANILLDCLSENVPAQAGNAVALAKSILGQTSAGYKEISRAAQQANGVLEGQFAAAGTQITQALEKSVNVIAEY